MELWGCNERALDNPCLVLSLLKRAVKASGAHPVESVCRHFDPQGVTGIMMVQESHFAVHTWPEKGYAAIDAFTCGERCDPMKAVEVFKRGFKAKSVDVREITRGVRESAQEEGQPLAAVS